MSQQLAEQELRCQTCQANGGVLIAIQQSAGEQFALMGVKVAVRSEQQADGDQPPGFQELIAAWEHQDIPDFRETVIEGVTTRGLTVTGDQFGTDFAARDAFEGGPQFQTETAGELGIRAQSFADRRRGAEHIGEIIAADPVIHPFQVGKRLAYPAVKNGIRIGVGQFVQLDANAQFFLESVARDGAEGIIVAVQRHTQAFDTIRRHRNDHEQIGDCVIAGWMPEQAPKRQRIGRLSQQTSGFRMARQQGHQDGILPMAQTFQNIECLTP